MYDTAEEAQQKLTSSIVLYNTTPVFIQASTGRTGSVRLHFLELPLGSASQAVEDIHNPLWDFRTLGERLGYTAIKNPVTGVWSSAFLSRIPIRQSRQGLDSRTVSVTPVEQESQYIFSFNDIINKVTKFADTVKGVFPSSVNAFTLLQTEEYSSVPIHRKLVLVNDEVSPCYLVYRGVKVGYTEDGVTFKLSKLKRYLYEELVDMNFKVI